MVVIIQRNWRDVGVEENFHAGAPQIFVRICNFAVENLDLLPILPLVLLAGCIKRKSLHESSKHRFSISKLGVRGKEGRLATARAALQKKMLGYGDERAREEGR